MYFWDDYELTNPDVYTFRWERPSFMATAEFSSSHDITVSPVLWPADASFQAGGIVDGVLNNRHMMAALLGIADRSISLLKEMIPIDELNPEGIVPTNWFVGGLP